MTKSLVIASTVAVADPEFPANVLQPNADGSINVNASSSPSSPSYVVESALSYSDVSIASLSQVQADGTTAIFNVDVNRKALVINPPADCGLGLTSGGPAIWPLFANVPNSFIGQECPTSALYLTAGLSAGQPLPMAVG